jgi:translation initiation factor 1 (eIF-1/SUI1)
MWVDPADPNARNKNTYLSGWNISKTEKKEHLKNIKKKASCNGTIKTIDNVEVIQLQGNHIVYLRQYMNSVGITNIKIKG